MKQKLTKPKYETPTKTLAKTFSPHATTHSSNLHIRMGTHRNRRKSNLRSMSIKYWTLGIEKMQN
jgi:hypothetical protein